MMLKTARSTAQILYGQNTGTWRTHRRTDRQTARIDNFSYYSSLQCQHCAEAL